MFGNKIKSPGHKGNASPGESISMISKTMHIHGDVEAANDMRIDGRITGNVFCKARIVIGPSGVIDGELHCENADIFGTVNGNIHTDDLLCLKSKCMINGNLNVGRLNIEADAAFNGKCTMHGDQVATPANSNMMEASVQ